MDTVNQLAYNLGAYVVFHPIRSLTAYLTVLALAVAAIIWTSQPEPDEP